MNIQCIEKTSLRFGSYQHEHFSFHSINILWVMQATFMDSLSEVYILLSYSLSLGLFLFLSHLLFISFSISLLSLSLHSSDHPLLLFQSKECNQIKNCLKAFEQFCSSYDIHSCCWHWGTGIRIRAYRQFIQSFIF